MTINEAQKQVDQWINTTGVRYFNELTNMAILTEEVGELARHMARQYGEQSYREKIGEAPVSAEQRKEQLADEMADVLWVLCALANQCDINLEEALQKNFEKKNGRDKG